MAGICKCVYEACPQVTLKIHPNLEFSQHLIQDKLFGERKISTDLYIAKLQESYRILHQPFFF